jgi:transporter family-2 protein
MPKLLVFLSMYALAAGAGVSFIFQQVINANLRSEIGSPWWAGLISYLGGTIVMFGMVVAMREPWLSAPAISRTSLISWTGGIFGAVYIAVSILLLPRLGAAVVVALIVLGQMVGAMLFDHYGLLGLPQTPITLTRLGGAALLIGGVVLMRL